MAGGFQTAVNDQPAVAIPGDFCDTNPRYTVNAGPGGLYAGPNGVTIGRFAWATNPDDADGTPARVDNTGSGPVTGFVAREQQGLVTTFLADSSMVAPSGFPLTLFDGGGFWVKNDGTGQALPGAQAYANFVDGRVSFALSGATASAWGIVAGTSSGTVSVVDAVMTATAGTNLYPGVVLTGGAQGSIVRQISGTTAGAGVYQLSVPEQTVAAGTAITGTYGALTLTTVTAGVFAVGDTLTGATAGVTAGTAITAMLTGTGGSGSTGIVNLTQTSGNAGEGVLTAALNVATKWYARSSALAGEMVKISSQPQG